MQNVTLADEGGSGVRKMLTLAYITDKMLINWQNYLYFYQTTISLLISLVIYCNFFKEIWSFRERVVLNMLKKKIPHTGDTNSLDRCG